MHQRPDRVICMRGGGIEQVGTPDDLYLRPASLFIAGFIGSPPVNLIRGTAENGAVHVGATDFPSEGIRGDVTIGLRPEHLKFAGDGLRGRIAQIEPMGREILYVVDTDVGHVRVLEHGSAAAYSAGEAVHIDFSPAEALLFRTGNEKLIAGANVCRRYPGPGRRAVVLKSILKRWPWLRHVFVDGGYAGPKLKGALQKVGKFTLEIIKRPWARA